MTIQFAPKTVTLIAAVQNTLTWGLAEFSRTLGQDHGIIRDQISLSFQVVNNTTQVCYIGLSYSTIKNTFNVSDRKSVAAVPANGQLNITPLTTPSLAIIGPDITQIQMTLLSAAAGNIIVNLQVDTAQANSGSGSTLFGLDDRSIQDYIIKSQINITQVAPGVTSSTIYTVPIGKRAFIEAYYASIEQTPVFNDYARAELIINTVNTALRLFSSFMMPVRMNLDARFLVLESGDVMELRASCSAADGSNVWVTQLAVVREVF